MSRRFGSGSLGQTLGDDSNSRQKFQSSISKTFGWTLKFVKSKFFEKLEKNYKILQKIEMLASGPLAYQTFTPGPWRKAQIEGHFSCIYFKCLKKSANTKKNCHLSNTFWLYQHSMRNE